ncbi:zinc finger containing protein [Metarhizium album ARSEF 1941]|uniref:Zinc finger containing protein n=1 Tax=Metarhizium album (strain ARSEF 1941) TaxID=1081103 RepID=A0A0B2X6F2_METAS|nr:zinc finger containing protein [Metarhizium album ARSEF 1941]KHO00866.1 zinc finger containing protein [Metarhizium album ARSEF 1941]
MSHSKRNTSRAVFTSHERLLAKANWSSSSARLNRDSFLPFGSCGLCLEIARDPVACRLGDIFCRECILANLLAQKRELKRAEKARREAEHEALRAKAADDDEDQKRAVLDFELTQAGLPDSKKRAILPNQDNSWDHEAHSARAGAKRKFTLDENELIRIAKEDKVKARRAIEDERAAKPSLPSFWTPSLTPDVLDSKLPSENKATKTAPTCPASTDDKPHAISMQKLVTIQFQQGRDQSAKGGVWTCPSCLKTLSNSSSPVMAKQCGHVLCLSCVKKFLVPSRKEVTAEDVPLMCYVCESPIVGKSAKHEPSTSKLPAGLVLLKSEGTGFSARGSNTVERSGVAFQC